MTPTPEALEPWDQHSQRALVDRLPVGLIEVGEDGHVRLLNQEARRLTGATTSADLEAEVRDALIHVAGSVSPEHPVAEMAVRSSADSGGLDLMLTAGRTPNHVAGEPALVVVRDVTEYRRFDGELNRIHRINSFNQLAGVVARDVDALLTVILGYTELAIGDFEGGDDLLGDLVVVRTSTERARILTDQLHTLSGQRVVRPVRIDPSVWLRRRAGALGRLTGPDAKLTVAAHRSAGSVRIDPAQLEQVLVQLLLNARESIPGTGTITVTTRSMTMTDGRPGVGIAVKDDGVGMGADTLARCSEPLFSTKPSREGSGLGLAIVRTAVAQADGEVRLESVPGAGTVVTVVLPVASLHPHRSRRGGARRPAQRILLVVGDDEWRGTAAEALAAAGYRVDEARTAAVALHLLGDGLRPDAVVAQVVQSGPDGRTFADRLAELLPGTPVMLLATLPEAHPGPTTLGSLERDPSRTAELVQTVRDALVVTTGTAPQGSKR